MLCGHPTMRPPQHRFYVGDKPVRPWEQVTRHLGTYQHHTMVRDILILCHFSVGFPAVAADLLDQKLLITFVNSQPIQDPTDGLCRGISDDLRMRKTRALYPLLVDIDRDGNQDSRFPLASTAPLAFTRWRAEEGFIQLHEACQPIPRIPLAHGFADLVGHYPDRLVVSYLKLPLHLSNRYASFRNRHPVDKPKPFSKGHLCPVKYRPRAHRYLMATGLTFIQTSVGDHVITIMVTTGTAKAFWPPYAEQVFHTLVLGIKLVLKFKQRDLLIRHLIFSCRSDILQDRGHPELCQ